MVEEMTKQLELSIVRGSPEGPSDGRGAADLDDSKGQTAVTSLEHSNTLSCTDESLTKPDCNNEVVSLRKRVFFPANREDALLLLGGICISEYFPEPSIALAVTDKGIAFVEDGLRILEANLLDRGRRQNFPLLIEVNERQANFQRVAILPPDIKAIWFRSPSECDEFRFRSVEEFDASTYPCSVDPERCGLEGTLRFERRTGSALADLGRLADKFSDGVLSIIDLGNRQPSCREAVWSFFGTNRGEESSLGLEFGDAVNAIIQSPDIGTDENKTRTAIISAFFSAVDPSPRALLERIRSLLIAQSSDGGTLSEPILKSLDFYELVVRNQTALTGDRLSDEKFVLLRGALLGLMVNDVDALETFLNAEQPSGARVTAIAAFLLGLKRGILSSSWEQKKRSLQLSPFLIADILEVFVKAPNTASKVISATRKDTASSYDLSLICAERELVTWQIEAPLELSERERIFATALGMETLKPTTRSEGRRGFNIQTASGYTIEIIMQQSKSPNSVTLRYYLAPDQKLRKPKDLREYGSAGGRVWYPISDDQRRDFLYCDLVSVPDNDGRQVVFEALAATLGEIVITQTKVKRLKEKQEKGTSAGVLFAMDC